IEDVLWLADNGGSTVLTQAMQILVDKGIKLKGHTAYLYKPRTSPGQVIRLAHQLEMTLNESFADTGLSLRGAASQLAVAGARLSNEHDLYNTKSFVKDWLSGLVKVAGPMGVAAGAVSLGTSVVMVGTIAGVISTGGTLIALGQSAAENIRHKIRR